MPKKIIHMLNSMGMGGVENFIMNVYRELDREKYQFDFVLQCEEESYFEKEIREMGGQIYKIPRIEKHPILHMKSLKQILRENNYIAFHRHTASSVVFVDLLLAKKARIPVRIAHSHSTTHDKKILNSICRPWLISSSTKRLACGNEAGKWLFGQHDFDVVQNGIPTQEYLYSPATREEYRQELHLNNKIVIGHVGRFNEVKNHQFLIEVFHKLYSQNPKYHLVLCGGGPLENKMKELCQKYEIEKGVSFLGIREDVSKILQAIDIFAFPSLYEGLSLTLIEAQLSKLPIVASQNIPKETFYNSNITTLDITSDDIENWVKAIQKIEIDQYNRSDVNPALINNFDIRAVTNTLVSIYEGR